MRIAYGGIYSGIGNAITISACTGCSSAKNAACTKSCLVNRCTLYDRVGTCKVDIFKNAQSMRTLAAMIFYGAYSVFIEYNNLAGEQISYKLCADRVKSAAFGGNYICSLVCYAVAERSEAVLVTAAISFAGDMITSEYAPFILFIARLSASSIEGASSRSFVTR